MCYRNLVELSGSRFETANVCFQRFSKIDGGGRGAENVDESSGSRPRENGWC